MINENKKHTNTSPAPNHHTVAVTPDGISNKHNVGNELSRRVFGSREMHKKVLTKLNMALSTGNNSWRNVVIVANDNELFHLITSSEIVQINNMIHLMYHAAKMAFDNPNNLQWNEVCDSVVKFIPVV